MSIDSQQVKETLNQRRVLIVEDDRELANRIASLIEGFTEAKPVVVHTMETARKKVRGAKDRFDLALLDIMLPRTEEHFGKIGVLEERLETLRIVIKGANSRQKDDSMWEALVDARDERAYVQRQIEELIVLDGGIQLADEWRDDGLQFPILFLTAIGAVETSQLGLKCAGNRSAWIVKPAPSDRILDECVALLKN